MRFFIIITIFILLSVSCKHFQNDGTKDIISRDTFVMALIDMHITDIFLSKEQRLDRNLNDTTGKISYYNFMYKKYHINEYRFTKTVDYYSQHCDEYSLIYKDVIDELSKRRSDLDSLQKKKTSTKTDSINLPQTIAKRKRDSLLKFKKTE